MTFIVASMRFDIFTRVASDMAYRLMRAWFVLVHTYCTNLLNRLLVTHMRCGIFANICLLPSLLAAAFDAYLALIMG